jgi:hypothetical protein
MRQNSYQIKFKQETVTTSHEYLRRWNMRTEAALLWGYVVAFPPHQTRTSWLVFWNKQWHLLWALALLLCYRYFVNLKDKRYTFLDGGSDHRKASTFRGQHTKMRTRTTSWAGIETSAWVNYDCARREHFGYRSRNWSLFDHFFLLLKGT